MHEKGKYGVVIFVCLALLVFSCGFVSGATQLFLHEVEDLYDNDNNSIYCSQGKIAECNETTICDKLRSTGQCLKITPSTDKVQNAENCELKLVIFRYDEISPIGMFCGLDYNGPEDLLNYGPKVECKGHLPIQDGCPDPGYERMVIHERSDYGKFYYTCVKQTIGNP